MICSGSGRLAISGESREIRPPDKLTIDGDADVRLQNPGTMDLVVLEVICQMAEEVDHLI